MIGKRPRAEEDAALRRQRQRRDEHEVLLELETFQNGQYDVCVARPSFPRSVADLGA